MKKRKQKIVLKTKRMQSASAQIDMSEFEGKYSIDEMKGVLKVMKKKLTNGRN